MNDKMNSQTTPRRGFLGALASGAAALGLASLATPFKAQAKILTAASGTHPADAWFNTVKGTHKVVFDATRPHEIFPFAWPKVFLMTNEATGTPANDCGVVVILRHAAICYAFEDKIWTAYGFGEMFEAPDPVSKEKAANRNPFWKTKPGDFQVPGIGEVAISIPELQAQGVKFCVCEAAMTVYSAVAAGKMNKKPEEVRAEWMAALLPGIQPVPSGVWAAGRAQEKGCAYIFAG